MIERELQRGADSEPLSHQIEALIRQQIDEQALPAHSKIASEAALAKQYGVSRGTVIKALDSLVRQEVLYRQRPRGTFVAGPREHNLPGIVPDQSSAQLPSIGVIIPFLTDGFDGSIIVGIEMVARAAGYGLFFAISENNLTLEQYHINQFLRRAVAGILIFPGDSPVERVAGRLISRDGPERLTTLRALQARQVPFALIDRFVPDLDCDYVVTDDEAAGYAATQHLLSLGHQRIGFISIAPLITSTAGRFAGYVHCLHDHKLEVDDTLTLHALRQTGPWSMPGGVLAPDIGQEDRTLLHDYLHQPDAPTAVIVVNDYIGLRVLQAAEDIGLEVPSDLALVCCGGGDVGAHARVPLTSILQPAVDLGRQAAHVLLDRITGRSSEVRHLALPVTLIVRKSCGTAPRKTALSVVGGLGQLNRGLR